MTNRTERLLALCFSLALVAAPACSSSDGGSGDTGNSGANDAGTTDDSDDDQTSVGPDAAAGSDSEPGDDDTGPAGGDPDAAGVEGDGGTTGDGPDGTAGDDDADPAEDDDAVIGLGDEFVKIVLPADGETVSGTIRVVIEPVGFDELKLEVMDITANGTVIFRDTKLPTEFRLDVDSIEGNSLVLEAKAATGMDQAVDTVTVEVDHEPFHFADVTPHDREYRNGQTIVVDISTNVDGITLGVDFTAIDSGWSAGDETIEVIGEGADAITRVSWTLSEDNVRPEGRYQLPVTGTLDDESLTYSLLWLNLRNLPETPFAVERAIYIGDQLPLPSTAWAGVAPLVEGGNDFVVTGGSAKIDVSFPGAAFVGDLIGIVVGMEGRNGYYQIPIDEAAGGEEILLTMRAFAETEVAPPVLPVRIALKDVLGRVSPYIAHTMTVQSVGSGDIQVSVSWDEPTDVDLHVVEPTGCELYYGNRECPSGGELDLDSNPACGIDGINNENVYWPAGQAPVGTYIVRVDFFSDCCSCGSNYTVTVNSCGKPQVYQGYFFPNTDDSGGAGDGVTVVEFTTEDCQKTLRGKIRYHDRTFDETGFAARTLAPARHAVVKVKRASDGEVLGEASTNQAGVYEMTFATTDELEGQELVLEVSTMTDATSGLRDILVADHPKLKQMYVVTSETFVDEADVEIIEMNLDITDPILAGAFNVFDVLVRGHDLIRLLTGRDLGELRGFWKTGTDTTDTLFCSEFFYNQGVCTELGSVSVQGKDTDRDEYDDMVILEEFFKMVLERFSRDDNPGGINDGTRTDPRQAWTEGVAAFFACDTLDTRYFVNSRPLGVYEVRDLEDMTTPFSFGTDGNVIDADASELMISSALWDLSDSNTSEVWDAVHGRRAGVYDSLFSWFTSDDFQDRGAIGIDLTDFLDGWFCRGWAEHNAVEDIIVHHRKFPYDFQGPIACIYQ